MRLVLLILALSWGGARAAEVMPAAPAAYCNDYAGLLRPATVQALNTALDQFERATSTQLLVAIYPKFPSDSSVEDYTVRVFSAWGVGQKGRSNGAVLFVFVAGHQLRIATGYGLEGSLPDALCKRIIEDEIAPRFRSGDYDGGITAGVRAMAAAVKGEYRGTGHTRGDRQGRGGSPWLIPLFFVFVIGWSLVRSRRQVVYRGSGSRGMWGGGGPWIFPGGGGGGFGGGGGSSGGGFSGGGGSSGGGGAGGSW